MSIDDQCNVPGSEGTSAEGADGVFAAESPAADAHAELDQGLERQWRDPSLAAVVTELEKPVPPAGSGQGLLVLGVTLFLFFTTGLFNSKPADVAILIGALFFHELGHYAAMRVFGYRDLKIFFIPFFGAAASGRKSRVPGYQEALVLLAGPLPGLILGAVLAACSWYWSIPLAHSAAQTLLIINGFNLLPIMPFDGGRLLNLLLFSRSPFLEAVFRLLTGIVLAAYGWFAGTWLLAALGCFMVLSTGYSANISRLAKRLRSEWGDYDTNGNETDAVPGAVAERLAEAVMEKFPNLTKTQAIVNASRQVYVKMQARSPGWAATLLLLAIHGFSLAAAPLLVLGVLLIPVHMIEIHPLPEGTIIQREIVRQGGRVRAANDLSAANLYHGKHARFLFSGANVLVEGEWRDGVEDGVWTFFPGAQPLAILEFDRGRLVRCRMARQSSPLEMIPLDQVSPALQQALAAHRACDPHGPTSPTVKHGIPQWTAVVAPDLLAGN
jgi:Zn-dependent protease